MLKNPFPADGDASKIPKFTDFLICLRENRKERMAAVLRPLLDRANIGDVNGTHDAIIVGEIGRGKTHLLKFLEKKLLRKNVRLVSDSFEIPSYNNIFPVYVKLDASMTVKPELFVYFFINYVFGFNVKDFGIINSPIFENNRDVIEQKLSKLYKTRIKDNIEKPRVISTQQAMDLLFDACNEVIKLSNTTSVIFLFDELEGIILSAHKKTEESLNLVMDFFRQFHDEINKEKDLQEKVYALYAMTAPAYERARQAQQESGAWLSRLRSHVIEIPPFSEDELLAITSCALENGDLSDITPFNKDALAYIFRSVMGQPRFAIEALHNAFQLHIEKKIDTIGPKEVFISTTWLNPNVVIDKTRVAKLKSEFGSRYSYLIDLFSVSIQESELSLSKIVVEAEKNLQGEVTEERVIEDLQKFYPSYVDISENTKSVRVSQAFYNRILRQLDKETIDTKVLLEPAGIIESISESVPVLLKTGKISETERTSRLSEALSKVIKQLFDTEGVDQTILKNGYRIYQTSKTAKGDIIRILARPIINPDEVNHAEIIDLIEKHNASSVLFLIDLDDRIEEDKLRRKIDSITLPPSHPWVNQIFSGCFNEETYNWQSKRILDNSSKQLTLSQICVTYPVSYGKREFRGKSLGAKRVQIDVRGLWYSMTVLTRDFNAQFSQQLEETLRYMILDFYGSIRNEIIEKSLVKDKGINDLLKYTKKSIDDARILMQDKKCREAISEQQTILFSDLPPGINAPSMNRLVALGLFVRNSPTSWQANSINDARRDNPWICFIVMNYFNGQRKNEIKNIIKNANLGPYSVEVIKCINFYLQLLESFEFIRNDQIVPPDNKSKLISQIQRELGKIEDLKKREFANTTDILAPFSQRIAEIDQDTALIERDSKTELEKDDKYKNNLDALREISENLDKLIKKKKELAIEKNNEVDGLYSQADKVHKNSVNLFNSLNFNDKNSEIVKALMKNPEFKSYILEIPLAIKPPHLMPSVVSEKVKLDHMLNDGYLMRYLNESENLEIKLNEVIQESKKLENHISDSIANYLKNIREVYEKLLDVNRDFQIGSNAEITRIIEETQRRVSNEKFVESLIFAGQAMHLFVKYSEAINEKIITVQESKKEDLSSQLEKQDIFFKSSMRVIKKRIKKSNQPISDEFLKTSQTVKKKIDSIDLLQQPSLKNKTPYEILKAINEQIEEILKKESEIQKDLEKFNKKIHENNKSVFKVSIVKLLDFVSKFGKINSLNFSEFVKHVGSREEAEEIIPEIIEIGLASLDLEVKE